MNIVRCINDLFIYNKEELIHITKSKAHSSLLIKSEINTSDAVEFELPIEAIDKEIIEEMRFFGFWCVAVNSGCLKLGEVTMSDN